jgi:predicted DNA-binding transcriptional regulator AlpA
MEYIFTLSFQVSAEDADYDALVERLYLAGCDDALAGIGQKGRIALEFTREAENAVSAIGSAMADVRRAAPAAKLVEAAPDLVGLTDVADILGMSRQNMRKLMVRHVYTFPPPVHEGGASIWHLADILEWLMAKDGYAIDPALAEVAMAALRFNFEKEAKRFACHGHDAARAAA